MIAALFAALALAAQSAPGPDARSVPLDRVFPFWSDYHALPDDQRSAFTLDYLITLRGGGQAQFWVETVDGIEPLILDSDGAATPPSPEAISSGRRLFTDAPEGGASVTMRLSLSGEPQERYTLAELETAIAQAGAAMRSAMGLRSLLMPRLDTVRFSFDGPAPQAVLVFEDGTQSPVETVYGDLITIRPQDRALRRAVEVRFERAPVRAVLETGR